MSGGGKWRAIVAVALAFVALAATNLLASLTLRQARVDITQERLFTISDATRRVLARIEEPVSLTLYASRALGHRSAAYAEHMARVRTLLERYQALAPGRLEVRVVDPEPYSREEDVALAAGLRPVPLPGGRNGWLGIVGENMTGLREAIPFLPLERAHLLERDLTLVVHRLTRPRRPVVGVLSALPLFGGGALMGRPQPEWAFIALLREQFEVRPVGNAAALEGVDALLVFTPVELDEDMARALRRHALSGKPLVMGVDPWTETVMSDPRLVGQGALAKDHVLLRMLKDWGIEAVAGRFVADPAFARAVVFAAGGRRQQASYLAWLELKEAAFARAAARDMFMNVQSVNVGSAGAFSLRAGARLEFLPLWRSSPAASLMETRLLMPPRPLEILAMHTPGEKRLVLAARVRGEVENGRLNLLLLADTDFLHDRFWARLQDIGGGRKAVLPLAGNATFLMNALERMTGGAVLAGLRGRMLKDRPFTRVEEIRRAAERRFRARERELREQLKAAEGRLAGIVAEVRGDAILVSEKDRRTIMEVRREMLQLRRSLKDVQQALVRDIESLGMWLRALNIAGVAAAIALAGLGVFLSRRWRMRRARRLMARGE